jgi:pyruvate formate lyase activating enzyme
VPCWSVTCRYDGGGVNDDAEEIDRIGEFVADLPALQRMDLLPYHDTAVEKYRRLGRLYPLTAVLLPSAQRMDEVAEILRGLGLTVRIGG